MRVQCDVCEKNVAAVMCCADEAALCTQCDLRVHAANKLANKHQRVSLLVSNGEHPVCDICQEKSAFFFCQEDRALLCRECDVSIHLPNTLSEKHRRFLMTGTRVALEAAPCESSDTGVETSPPVTPTVGLTSPNVTSGNHGSHVHNSRKAFSQAETPFLPSTSASHSLLGRGAAPGASSDGYTTAVTSYGMPRGGTGGASTSAGVMSRKNSFENTDVDGLPGWKVDELLNIPELADGYTLADVGSSKADMEANLGDFDWTADLSLFDEQVYAESLHEVPSLPPSINTSGVPARNMQSALKGRARDSSAMVPDFDDAFLVPDLGLDPAPPLQKRSRNFI